MIISFLNGKNTHPENGKLELMDTISDLEHNQNITVYIVGVTEILNKILRIVNQWKNWKNKFLIIIILNDFLNNIFYYILKYKMTLKSVFCRVGGK